MIHTFTRKDLKDSLMDPSSDGPKECFFIIEGEGEENITVINPGKNGIEYNKTSVMVNTKEESGVINCLYGQGAVVLQRNDFEGEPKEIRIVSIRQGSTFEIPSGYLLAFVNTGKSYFVISDNFISPKKEHEKLITPKKGASEPRHGLAYYIVEKRGERTVDKNPNYHFHPEISL